MTCFPLLAALALLRFGVGQNLRSHACCGLALCILAAAAITPDIFSLIGPGSATGWELLHIVAREALIFVVDAVAFLTLKAVLSPLVLIDAPLSRIMWLVRHSSSFQFVVSPHLRGECSLLVQPLALSVPAFLTVDRRRW